MLKYFLSLVVFRSYPKSTFQQKHMGHPANIRQTIRLQRCALRFDRFVHPAARTRRRIRRVAFSGGRGLRDPRRPGAGPWTRPLPSRPPGVQPRPRVGLRANGMHKTESWKDGGVPLNLNGHKEQLEGVAKLTFGGVVVTLMYSKRGAHKD